MNLLIIVLFALTLICFCLFVAYFGKKWNLKPLVAIGSGALLSISFLEFLPHAFESHSSHEEVSVFILTGILVQGLADIYLLPHLTFLDKLVQTKDSQPIPDHSHSFSPGAVCSVTGCLSICSFFDGIRLLAALNIGEFVAVVTALALFFHLLSEGVLLAVLGLSSGIKKQIILVLALCIGGALVLGALLAQVFFISFSPGILIAFSSGILIYICFVHLLPFCLKQNNKSWFFIGLILFSSFHFLA